MADRSRIANGGSQILNFNLAHYPKPYVFGAANLT
jgi:hypothetical protein